MCVNLDNPTIRFFARDLGGNGKSDLKITVLYEDLNGKTQHLDLAKIRASSDWGPSIAIPIGVNFLSAASANGVTVVAFQFKAEGLQKNETLEVDNLYVDPFCSRGGGLADYSPPPRQQTERRSILGAVHERQAAEPAGRRRRRLAEQR